MQFFYISAMVIMLNSVVIQANRRPFTLQIQNVSCQSFSNEIKHYECGYRKVTNGLYFLNASFMYDRKFGKDIDMHLRLTATPWKSKTVFNIVDIRVKFCTVTTLVFSNYFLRLIFTELIRASNYPVDCSFKGNFMYKVVNLPLMDKFIPTYAPYLDTTFSIDFWENNKITSDYCLKAALIPKKLN